MIKGWFHIICIGILCSIFPITLQASLSDFTVVIDAGHGGKDPGAIGARTKEKKINLSVALLLGEMIKSNYKNVKVVYTRKTDRFVELQRRADIANKNKAQLFISLHTNAVKRGAHVHGTETYTLGLARTDENFEVAKRENSAILLEDNYLTKYEGFDPNSSESYIIFEFMQNKHMEQSVSFASLIQKQFKSQKRNNRGVRQAGLLVLRATSMPAVLVELGFITNRNEERYMMSRSGQKKLAQSIFQAFSIYKNDFDRKNGVPVIVSGRKSIEKRVQPSVVVVKKTYKIQFLTSGKKLQLTSRKLKGYHNVSVERTGNIYKYLIGDTTDKKQIMDLYRKVKKDFKDAFIVSYVDGQRVR